MAAGAKPVGGWSLGRGGQTECGECCLRSVQDQQALLCRGEAEVIFWSGPVLPFYTCLISVPCPCPTHKSPSLKNSSLPLGVPKVTWDGSEVSLVLDLLICAAFGTASSQWCIGQSTLVKGPWTRAWLRRWSAGSLAQLCLFL